jgi:dephospho-CoA kinase
MKLIIGIVGERLAGKDSVAQYLVQKHNAYHIKYSAVMDEVLDILDLPKTRRNEMDISNSLRQTFHQNVWWDAIKKKILASAAPIVVINGNRFKDEYEAVRGLGAKMLYVTAPHETLFERFVKRQEKPDDNKMNLQQFMNLDNEPTEKQIPLLGAQADFKIENTGSMEELYKKVDEVLELMK